MYSRTFLGIPGTGTNFLALLGKRLSKTVNGVTTRFLYDGDDLIEETDGTGTIQATYVFGPGIDEPLTMTRGGENRGTSYLFLGK